MTQENYFTYISLARTGSSWLYQYLKNHTTAQMPAIKEFHWFDYPASPMPSLKTQKAQELWDTIQRRVQTEGLKLRPRHLEIRDRAAMRSDDDYRHFFTSRYDADAVFGDMTPAYGRLDADGYARILAAFPKAKFIFLMRNPAENMWSRAAHSRHPTTIDMTLEDRVIHKLNNVSGDQEVPLSPDVYARACQSVGPARIHTQFTEHLFSNRADRTLQSICSFLGITGEPVANHDYSRNRGVYHPMPEDIRAKVVQVTARSYLWAQQNIPDLPDNWQRDIDTYL